MNYVPDRQHGGAVNLLQWPLEALQPKPSLAQKAFHVFPHVAHNTRTKA